MRRRQHSGEVTAGTPARPGWLWASTARRWGWGWPGRTAGLPSGELEARKEVFRVRAQAGAGVGGVAGYAGGPLPPALPPLADGSQRSGQAEHTEPQELAWKGEPRRTTSAVCPDAPAQQLELGVRVPGVGDVLRPSVCPAAWWFGQLSRASATAPPPPRPPLTSPSRSLQSSSISSALSSSDTSPSSASSLMLAGSFLPCGRRYRGQPQSEVPFSGQPPISWLQCHGAVRPGCACGGPQVEWPPWTDGQPTLTAPICQPVAPSRRPRGRAHLHQDLALELLRRGQHGGVLAAQ